MAREEKPAVERLKNRLYARGAKTESGEDRTPLSENESADVPTGWNDVKPVTPVVPEIPKDPLHAPLPIMKKKRFSFAAKFLIGSILFFLCATGVAAYMFFGGGNLISPQNIDIQIVAPSLIDGGKEATFQVLIQNHNEAALTNADLIIDYPDGARSATNLSQALTHDRQTIGTIETGAQIKKEISGVFYGTEGAQENLKVTLEYTVSGSNAIFQKESNASFTIGSAPVSINVTAPTEAISGETFPIDIEVRSNSATPLSGVVVQGVYPFGYSYGTSNPQASAGGTFWQLGTLAPGSSKTIHITGSIDGQDGDQRVFRFLAGSNTDPTDTQVKVPFLTVPQTLTVRKPFVSGTISINGQSGKTISATAGQTLQGTITWQNNTQDPISNLQIGLALSGPALDTNSIQATNGFYQSANSSIIWSSAQDADLVSVAPGATGQLQFSFATLPTGSGNVLITNPTINLNLTVQGNRQNSGNVPEQVSSAASAMVELASQVSLTAVSEHSQGGFTNIGPVPPKAETATSYTILWTVKNSSNTIANASVSATLPPYVDFMQAPNGSGISYDSGSRTVTWNLGDVKSGVGYNSAARQAAFQVTLTPSSSQVGQTPQLTGDAVLSGQDRFAQVQVSATASGPTAQTSDGASGVVAPK
jgi:hypothetical protein